jgi:hypothetical protein
VSAVQLVDAVQSELSGRKGLLDDVDDDIQRELSGAVAARVLRAAAGDLCCNCGGELEYLADEIEEDQ